MGEYTKWSVSPELHDLIQRTVPPGSHILELGSGVGTKLLAQDYRVTSIEHDYRWMHVCPTSQYIYAPITPFRKPCAVFPEDTGWYDRQTLERALPEISPYDLILVDGPPGEIGRGGFCKWLHLFNTHVPIIFDDVHRRRDNILIQRVSAKLKRPYTVHAAWTDCHFAIIYP